MGGGGGREERSGEGHFVQIGARSAGGDGCVSRTIIENMICKRSPGPISPPVSPGCLCRQAMNPLCHRFSIWM